eukprot:13168690-Alexandrium_andersonii.AAC.1
MSHPAGLLDVPSGGLQILRAVALMPPAQGGRLDSKAVFVVRSVVAGCRLVLVGGRVVVIVSCWLVCAVAVAVVVGVGVE